MAGIALVLIVAVMTQAPAYAQLSISEVTITDTRRLGREIFEYDVTAKIQNTGPQFRANVRAQLVKYQISVTPVEEFLDFGNVAPGNAIATSDTFTIRVDLRNPFDLSLLDFEITGVVDVTPPSIQITSPADGSTTKDAQPTIVIAYSDDAAGVDDTTLNVTVNGSSALLACKPLSGGAQCEVSSPLSPGLVTIEASVADFAGNTGNTQAAVTVQPGDDTQAPAVTIVRPSEGLLVIANPPQVEIIVTDDDSGVDTNSIAVSTQIGTDPPVAVGATCAFSGSNALCTLAAAIPEGASELRVTAADNAGNVGAAAVDIFVDSIPINIIVDSPSDGFITQDDSVVFTGTVSDNVTALSVEGVPAQILDGAFTATVPLREGLNLAVVLAEGNSGRTGSRTVSVWRDNTAPIVRIDSPVDNFVSFDQTIAITGTVNDIVNGGTLPRVFVNEFEATVMGNSFMVTGLDLMPGPNRFTAIALDAAGNQATNVINVQFSDVAGARLNVVSGNGQAGVINTALPEVLEVRVRDELNNPIAGRLVTFRVVRNSGMLEPVAGGMPVRILQVPTNGSGVARARYSLGETIGEGNNRVSVIAQGVPGQVEFCASAMPAAADKILMQMGDNQRGLVGNPLDMPFEALVVDVEGNPVAGVAVTFEVIRGAGTIDGKPEAIRQTDIEGVARAILLLDPEPGINNNIVRATTVGVNTLPATFVASGLAQGDPAQTRFKGVVLDNTQTPIPGAMVTIDGAPLPAFTDAEGQFTVENVPFGQIHLRIDPTDSPRPETFPPLEFETIAVAGQENVLGQPIQIPAIDVGATQIVGGDEDIVLTMPGVDGMTLTVFANSVTFGDGSKVGPVSISQVHLDKVPMPPPSGTFFMPPAWTIQPAGTHFDPPAKISIPNDGLPPGRVIDIFQFDHALNEFIDIGTGTVTEDASIIVSDPGFGITRAGWGGCGQPPPPDTCADSCNDGDVCNGLEFCEDGSCRSGPPPPPETPVSPQTPGNCQTETCGGSEPNDGDTPEDAPGDCQSPVCMNGSPGSEPNDGDVPEDTPGDCQAPTCMDGSPGSEDDNADVPEDTPGDCQAPTCMDGAPGSEDDNGDVPEDTPGDCQAPTCMDGAPGSEDDDGDVPEDSPGDCQAPVCMDGSPGMEDDNADLPEEIIGDCQAPMCMDGAPGQMPDDADIGEDMMGDCRAPVCMMGVPGDEADDADVPEDTPGDCQAAICMNGAPDMEADDNDTPDDECKFCMDGAIMDVDTSSFFDDLSVAAEVVMPDSVKSKVQNAMSRIPGLGGVTIEEARVGVTGQSKDCCESSLGIIEDGIAQGAGTGQLKFFADGIQLWPLPPTSISRSWIFESFGQVVLVEIDFALGVFFDATIDFSGQIGVRRNQCEGINCGYGQAQLAATVALRATAEAIACLEVDTFLGDRRDCGGFGVTPAQLSLSVNGGFGVNLNECGEGLDGRLFIGTLIFQASFFVGLPGVGEVILMFPILPGFEVF